MESEPEEPSGNTDTLGDSKSNSSKNYQVYRWQFTLKREGANVSQLLSTLREWCKQFTFQGEKGGLTEYEHWQGCFSLKVKHRMSEVKNMLGWSSIHLEPAHNWFALRNYCSKEETRTTQTYTEKTTIIKTIEVLRPWQEEVRGELLKQPDERTIRWIWCKEGNSGKTVFAKFLAVHHEACVFNNGKCADLAHALPEDPRIVLFNLSRTIEGHVNYGAIESIKDGLIFSAKYDSKMKLFNCPHVVIFANFAPDYESMSADRWVVTQLDSVKPETPKKPSEPSELSEHESIVEYRYWFDNQYNL